MRFRQLICPMYKNLYDVCLNQAPFYQNEVYVETRPDHNYSRPWIDDPTIATALPRVQLFFNSNSMYERRIFLLVFFISKGLFLGMIWMLKLMIT